MILQAIMPLLAAKHLETTGMYILEKMALMVDGGLITHIRITLMTVQITTMYLGIVLTIIKMYGSF